MIIIGIVNMGKINNAEGKKKKKSCVKPAIDVQKEANKNTCAFCHQPKLEGNEVERAGNLFKLGNKYYHYFCVLFCQNVDQNGEDDEGLKGFLKDDIEKGLVYGKTKKCCYCGKKGAALKCNKMAFKPKDSQCPKKYHFPCALRHKNPHTFRFFGHMHSFCPVHRPLQKHEVKVKDKTCLGGCQEKIDDKDERIMISPCCGRKYHLSCIQGMASASGKHHFKCPACSVKDEFYKAALEIGIYVPDQDAAWEKDSFYDFESQGRLYQRCDAKVCQCPKGREHHLNGSKFEIVRCESCGCGGVHVLCGNLLKKSPLYICEKHSNNQRQMLDHIESVKRSSLWNGSDDEYSDEDDSLSTTSSYKRISQGTVIRKTPASEFSTSVFPSEDDDSDYQPDEETTENSETDRALTDGQNISLEQKSNETLNEIEDTALIKVTNTAENRIPLNKSDSVQNVSLKEPSNNTLNEVEDTSLSEVTNTSEKTIPINQPDSAKDVSSNNLIENQSILIEDSNSSSESEDDISENPYQVQEELTKLFQQSKKSPIKTYQSNNIKPFGLKHPSTHKKVALLPACSSSLKSSIINDPVGNRNTTLARNEHLEKVCALSSSGNDLVLPCSLSKDESSYTTVDKQQTTSTSESTNIIDNQECNLPTIEMTFSMANIPRDFPNTQDDNTDPEILTTKIIGFDSNNVVEIESDDDDIVCIDDSSDSNIDYRPREDLSTQTNTIYRSIPTISRDIEEHTVILD